MATPTNNRLDRPDVTINRFNSIQIQNEVINAESEIQWFADAPTKIQNQNQLTSSNFLNPKISDPSPIIKMSNLEAITLDPLLQNSLIKGKLADINRQTRNITKSIDLRKTETKYDDPISDLKIAFKKFKEAEEANKKETELLQSNPNKLTQNDLRISLHNKKLGNKPYSKSGKGGNMYRKSFNGLDFSKKSPLLRQNVIVNNPKKNITETDNVFAQSVPSKTKNQFEFNQTDESDGLLGKNTAPSNLMTQSLFFNPQKHTMMTSQDQPIPESFETEGYNKNTQGKPNQITQPSVNKETCDEFQTDKNVLQAYRIQDNKGAFENSVSLQRKRIAEQENTYGKNERKLHKKNSSLDDIVLAKYEDDGVFDPELEGCDDNNEQGLSPDENFAEKNNLEGNADPKSYMIKKGNPMINILRTDHLPSNRMNRKNDNKNNMTQPIVINKLSKSCRNFNEAGIICSSRPSDGLDSTKLKPQQDDTTGMKKLKQKLILNIKSSASEIGKTIIQKTPTNGRNSVPMELYQPFKNTFFDSEKGIGSHTLDNRKGLPAISNKHHTKAKMFQFDSNIDKLDVNNHNTLGSSPPQKLTKINFNPKIQSEKNLLTKIRIKSLQRQPIDTSLGPLGGNIANSMQCFDQKPQAEDKIIKVTESQIHQQDFKSEGINDLENLLWQGGCRISKSQQIKMDRSECKKQPEEITEAKKDVLASMKDILGQVGEDMRNRGLGVIGTEKIPMTKVKNLVRGCNTDKKVGSKKAASVDRIVDNMFKVHEEAYRYEYLNPGMKRHEKTNARNKIDFAGKML